MDAIQDRPPYWVSGYDRPRLAVAALILLVAMAIGFLPGRPVTRSRVVPPAPPEIRPTVILSPTAGTRLEAGQATVVEGLAHPDGIVRLYWYSQPIGEPTRVAPDGRWQFTLGNLPAGSHALRAGAVVAGRSIWSSETVFTVTAPAVRSDPKSAPAGQRPASNRRPAGTRP